MSTQDPLLTAVGLATLGIAIVMLALAGKAVLRAAWLLSTRRHTSLATIAALSDPAHSPPPSPPTPPTATPASPHRGAPEATPTAQADCDQLEHLDITELAEAAGAGKVAHHSARSLEDMLAVMESDGWIALHELILDGIRVRHAVVGPGGAFAFQTRLPRWTMGDIALADLRAAALARTLGVPEDDVDGVVVIPGSSEPPRRWYGPGGANACVIGEQQLAAWLYAQPRRLHRHDLRLLTSAIDQAAAAARTVPRMLGRVHHG